MKQRLYTLPFIVLIFAVSFVIYGYNLKSNQDPGAVSLEEYYRITGNSEKKVLVYFHAGWCAICAKTKPIIDELGKWKEIEILKVDTDKSKAVAEEFEIDGLPVFMYYEHANRKWIHVGIIDKKQLLQKLNLPE